jgi:hypothetical protein
MSSRVCCNEEAIVPVISVPQVLNEDDPYADLRSIFGHSLLKCEGFNFAGSIKLKAATEMVETAEHFFPFTSASAILDLIQSHLSGTATYGGRSRRG